MPMQWNDQADARLFANVLKLHVVKLDYSSLARAMGEGVTPKAISHRIAKIKEKALAHRASHPYTGNTTSATKKRGPKAKKVVDDEDLVMNKIKSEKVQIKMEDQTDAPGTILTSPQSQEEQNPSWFAIGQSAIATAYCQEPNLNIFYTPINPAEHHASFYDEQPAIAPRVSEEQLFNIVSVDTAESAQKEVTDREI